MTDPTERDAKWQANEAELNRLYALPESERDALRIDDLENEQDVLTYQARLKYWQRDS